MTLTRTVAVCIISTARRGTRVTPVSDLAASKDGGPAVQRRGRAGFPPIPSVGLLVFETVRAEDDAEDPECGEDAEL
ncbi:hypothetical protein [Streptomyces sp. NPDC054901]